MARPAGFEPATYGFEVRRSIQLSYGRVPLILDDSPRIIQPGSKIFSGFLVSPNCFDASTQMLLEI